MNKYWEVGEKNEFGKECYKLHFSQFYEEEKENVVAGFVQDETDENVYIYVSEEDFVCPWPVCTESGHWFRMRSILHVKQCGWQSERHAEFQSLYLP